LAVKVVELDLDLPFPDLQNLDLKTYTHIQILVRKETIPIGYAWIHCWHKRFLRENYIKHEIDRQLLYQLNRLELGRRLGEVNISKVEETSIEWPTLTVAVCTRGRPDSLNRALKSLLRLEYPPDKLEILVVDNAPPDMVTEQVAAQYHAFSYIVEPRPGLDWARNRAIKEALGEIIAFTDDDVEVDPLWAKALVYHFKNPLVMCVTGLVAPAERETRAQNLFEEYNGFGKGFEKRFYSAGLCSTWNYFPLGSGEFGTGASMAYRRSIFSEIGGFDEALDVGTPTHGAGDLDMFYRVVRANYLLVYEPQALLWHYHRADYNVLSNQIRDWGRGVYAFWTKTFLADPPMRRKTLSFGLIWYWRGYLKRILRSNRDHRKLHMREATGALQGVFAYFISRRKAKKIKTSIWPATEVRRGTGLALSSESVSLQNNSLMTSEKL
jgi:glycosyltransferase involved in cell wall biosynthesis